jgi:hypothetical protein
MPEAAFNKVKSAIKTRGSEVTVATELAYRLGGSDLCRHVC